MTQEWRKRGESLGKRVGTRNDEDDLEMNLVGQNRANNPIETSNVARLLLSTLRRRAKTRERVSRLSTRQRKDCARAETELGPACSLESGEDRPCRRARCARDLERVPTTEQRTDSTRRLMCSESTRSGTEPHERATYLATVTELATTPSREEEEDGEREVRVPPEGPNSKKRMIGRLQQIWTTTRGRAPSPARLGNPRITPRLTRS